MAGQMVVHSAPEPPPTREMGMVIKASGQEGRLASMIENIKGQVLDLQLSFKTEPERKKENQGKLVDLLALLKQIEAHQQHLLGKVQHQREELESIKAKHDVELHKDDVRPVQPVLMEELRGMNQTRLDEVDKARRFEEAQKPKGYVASGGLTGFRVATDLYSKHLTDPDPDSEAWRAQKADKKSS